MNILVCMKAVPVTAQVEVDGQFRLQRDGVKLQWNIADEAALEAALQLKGDGTVTVVSMGPKKLQDSMHQLLALGVDRAVLVTDPVFAGSDTLATARTLAAAAEKLGQFDLILCGRRAIDGETGQVPGMLASMLALPCVTNAEALYMQEGALCLRRRLEAGVHALSVALPAVVSVCEYIYALRLPGIMGMRRARQMQVELFSSQDLGLTPQMCGLKGSATRVVTMHNLFPGLRKGPKEEDIALGTTMLLKLCREVDS